MIKAFEDGTDIFQVLDAVKRRAGLFMLTNDLLSLYNFWCGYKLLAISAAIEIKNLNKFEEFSEFLRQELNEDYENSMGWFGYLHSEFGNEEGFRKFFEYLDKFKNTNEG